jgi:hypothetical protein
MDPALGCSQLGPGTAHRSPGAAIGAFLERARRPAVGRPLPSFPPVRFRYYSYLRIASLSFLLLLLCFCFSCRCSPPVVLLLLLHDKAAAVAAAAASSCFSTSARLFFELHSSRAAPYLQIPTLFPPLAFPAQSFRSPSSSSIIALRQYQVYCDTLPFPRAPSTSTPRIVGRNKNASVPQ